MRPPIFFGRLIRPAVMAPASTFRVWLRFNSMAKPLLKVRRCSACYVYGLPNGGAFHFFHAPCDPCRIFQAIFIHDGVLPFSERSAVRVGGSHVYKPSKAGLSYQMAAAPP